MLRVQHRVRPIASQAWAGDRHIRRRWQSRKNRSRIEQTAPFGLVQHESLAHAETSRKDEDSHVPASYQGKIPQQPSLIEQLFPEEVKRYGNGVRPSETREIPRIPLDFSPSPKRVMREADDASVAAKSESSRKLEYQMKQDGSMTSVLVLRNASTNLVEEDFRRLIPQGKHLEGWTLEQGDIVKVIPGRDLATLAQNGTYYLLFSSALSAFTYQGHATRMHLAAAQFSPSSLNSPLSPPAGYTIDGMDIGAALSAYALVPPTQRLELRQLKPPLSPLVASMIGRKGYRGFLDRSDRWPFEVRLTLEGPQLTAGRIRWILHQIAKRRGLNWSGDPRNSSDLSVTRWVPPQRSSRHALSVDEGAWTRVLERDEGEQAARDLAQQRRQSRMQDADAGDFEEGELGGSKQQQQRGQQSHQPGRQPNPVYIVGFHTERAAKTFVRRWHRMPLVVEGDESGREDEGDVPPVANVQLLW